MELSKGKISIVIPVFNAEKYLADVLCDLVEQSYDNLQIIIVDDGSTDGSCKIVERFMQQDSRISLIVSENGGPSKARNIGLRYATGEYIRFIDADDRIPIDSMEKLIIPYIQDESIDLTMGNYTCKEEKNFYLGDMLEKGKKDEKEFAEIFVRNVKSFYYGVPWNKLYKRDIIEKYQIQFDESLIWCEDFLFNIEYYKYIKYVYVLCDDNGVYEYCIRETGITENLSEWSKTELQQIDHMRFKRALAYFSQYGLENVYNLEWKYSGLYYRLSNIVNRKNGKVLGKRYKEFYQLVSNEEVFQYVLFKEKDSGLMIWKLLKYSVKYRCYRLIFILFIVKECMATYIKVQNPILRKMIKPRIPKFL